MTLRVLFVVWLRDAAQRTNGQNSLSRQGLATHEKAFTTETNTING